MPCSKWCLRDMWPVTGAKVKDIPFGKGKHIILKAQMRQEWHEKKQSLSSLKESVKHFSDQVEVRGISVKSNGVNIKHTGPKRRKCCDLMAEQLVKQKADIAEQKLASTVQQFMKYAAEKPTVKELTKVLWNLEEGLTFPRSQHQEEGRGKVCTHTMNKGFLAIHY